MKKQIRVTAGIAGMLLCGMPQTNADAAVTVHIRTEGRPSFVINSWPTFIYLPELGLSVSTNNAYDIVYYGNYYYVYKNGYWYRSSSHNGRWIVVKEHRLPYKIRKHRLAEIRKQRDIEYSRKYGNRWEKRDQQRHEDNRKDDKSQRFEDNRKDHDGRNDNDNRGFEERRK